MANVTNLDILRQIGTALQWYRVEKGWTDINLAAKVMEKGMSQIPCPYINKIESGKKIPNLLTITMLCNALEISLPELFDQAEIFAKREKAIIERRQQNEP